MREHTVTRRTTLGGLAALLAVGTAARPAATPPAQPAEADPDAIAAAVVAHLRRSVEHASWGLEWHTFAGEAAAAVEGGAVPALTAAQLARLGARLRAEARRSVWDAARAATPA